MSRATTDRRNRRPIAVLGWLAASIVLVLPFLVDLRDFDPSIYSIAAALVSLEIVDIGFRLWRGRGARKQLRDRPSAWRRRAQPYAIVMSVRDVQPELDLLLHRLAPYKARTWFVDDESCDQTPLYLRTHGWRCVSLKSNRKKPGALKALLQSLPADVETVIVLDPDAVPVAPRDGTAQHLESVVERFQRSGATACCPRVRFADGNALAAMQLLECEMAFGLGRRSLSPQCVTSGVAIYERKALQEVLSEHSLSVYAEDLENSLILIGKGRRIYYEDDLIIESFGKDRPGDWFSQRVGWAYGLLRVYVERFNDVASAARNGPWAFYNFAIYLGVMAILLAPLKLAGAVLLAVSFANGLDALLALNLIPNNGFTSPHYFATSYLASTVLTLSMVLYLRPRASVSSLLTATAFYCFYSAAHLVPVCLGYLNWISVRLTGCRLFRDHYTRVLEGEAVS